MTSDHNILKQKVICLGLGRTGVSSNHCPYLSETADKGQLGKTSSLRDALETLGCGPSYHMTTIIKEGGKDFAMWCKIGDGRFIQLEVPTANQLLD